MMILFGEGYDFFYEATYFGGILIRPSRLMRFTYKSGVVALSVHFSTAVPGVP